MIWFKYRYIRKQNQADAMQQIWHSEQCHLQHWCRIYITYLYLKCGIKHETIHWPAWPPIYLLRLWLYYNFVIGNWLTTFITSWGI